MEEMKAEEEVERMLSIQKDKFHYYFTATPDLLAKSLTDTEKYITFATIEDGIRTGAIVLPQFEDIGSAYIRNMNLEKWKESDIEHLAEGDNFVDERGDSIRTKIIDRYLQKRAEHG